MVRSRGKRLEGKLGRVGRHATRRVLRLRESSNNRHDLARRREHLENVTGIMLPTAEEEAADPADADQVYVVATRALIARVRETKDHYDLVQHENVDYGYRRNLAAIKPAGLAVLAVLLVVDAVSGIAGMGVTAVVTAAVVHVICALAWLLVVRRPWVREQADTYAKTLFEALEEPIFGGRRRAPAPDDQADPLGPNPGPGSPTSTLSGRMRTPRLRCPTAAGTSRHGEGRAPSAGEHRPSEKPRCRAVELGRLAKPASAGAGCGQNAAAGWSLYTVDPLSPTLSPQQRRRATKCAAPTRRTAA